MISSFALPLMLFLQLVRQMSPTQAALMLAPMAVVSGVLAPLVGRIITGRNAPLMAVGGLLLNGVGLVLYWLLMDPDTAVALLLVPSFVMGVGGAFMWSPVSITATRDLAPARAGAGSGVFNTTRQVGSVLGSALIAMMMQNRLAAHLPGVGAASGGAGEAATGAGGALPPFLHEGYAAAMGQAMLLPAAAVLVGAVLALMFRRVSPRTASEG